ncbi:EF-hand domain-containing protein [Lysobacter gummosus]|uniref:hypothetical protein n=1 Tax=Lysobacter gummosus TaxID=262324 RepID=UPI00363848C1
MKPMIRSLSPMLLALLTGLSASAAFAQNGSPPGSRPADPMPTSNPMQRTEPPVNDPRRDARTPPPSDAIGPATFTELDSNGDQKISRDEAALDARLAANFSTHDLDGDGSLSLSEYQAGQNKRVGDK